MRFVIFFIIVLICSIQARALASIELLDQSLVFPPEDSVISNHAVDIMFPTAQTFQVGITGELTRVDVEIVRASQTSLPLILSICKTSHGTPLEATSVASITLRAGDLPLFNPTFPYVGPYTSIDLSSFNIPATVGDVFAIVARSSEPDGVFNSYSWRMSHQFTNPYPVGALYEFNTTTSTWAPRFDNTDLSFKTYVTVPEPDSTRVIALAASAFGCTRRPRRT